MNVRANTWRGFNQPAYMSGAIGEFDYADNTAIGNSNLDSVFAFLFNRPEYGGQTMGNITGNRMYGVQPDWGIRFMGTGAGDQYVVDGNVLGEVAGFDPARIISLSGAGKVLTSLSGTEQGEGNASFGNNRRSAAGTHARMLALEAA
jgi:hypothetical protein